MAYIFDILVIIVFLLCILIGYIRGFVRSVLRIAGGVLAFIIAVNISAPIADLAYHGFIKDSIQTTIVSSVSNVQNEGIVSSSEKLLENMPDIIVNALETQGLGTPEAIAQLLNDQTGKSVESLAAAVEQRVVRPIAISLLRPLCMIICFILLLILVAILAAILDKIFKIPGLKQINSVLGAALGIVDGIIAVLLIVTIITLVSSSVSSDSTLSRETVEKTIVVSSIEKINPLSHVVKDVFD